MQTGALITAAGRSGEMEAFRPLLKIGGTTLIQREIDTLRKAGVSPIVVVTGYEAEALEKHLAHRGVICLRNDRFDETQMFDSVKIGLRYLRDKCIRVLFLPVDAPLFSEESLDKVLASDEKIVIPQHQGKTGHPILLHRQVIPSILDYEGEGGLRGAVSSCCADPEIVEVEDEGILMEVGSEEEYTRAVAYDRQARVDNKLRLSVRLTLEKKDDFFGPGTADFLELVEEKGSMLSACKIMRMSYSKGWTMIKKMEDNLGFPFLERKAGGSGGGNSRMTEEGRAFLENYRAMQRDAERSANAFFHLYFKDELD